MRKSIGMLRSISVVVIVAVFALAALAAKEFVMPAAKAAHTYPAHDEHPMEKVTFAVDPYDTQLKIKTFRNDYLKYGFIPLFVIVTNDSDAPIALTNIKVQLNTRDRGRSAPAEDNDVLRRVTNTRKISNEASGGQRLPLPFPKAPKSANNRDTLDELISSRFFAKAIEPHATHAGFLFFDVSGLDDPLRGATLVITGVRGADGNELMYFEVPLTKYLESREPI
jgi:hypothetical protein